MSIRLGTDPNEVKIDTLLPKEELKNSVATIEITVNAYQGTKDLVDATFVIEKFDHDYVVFKNDNDPYIVRVVSEHDISEKLLAALEAAGYYEAGRGPVRVNKRSVFSTLVEAIERIHVQEFQRLGKLF